MCRRSRPFYLSEFSLIFFIEQRLSDFPPIGRSLSFQLLNSRDQTDELHQNFRTDVKQQHEEKTKRKINSTNINVSS